MPEILSRRNLSKTDILLKRDIIANAEARDDDDVIQSLLLNFRKTGEPYFFNLMVECLHDAEELDRKFEEIMK